MSFIPKDPGKQAFRILQFAFILIPILAGADKFFEFLANWSNYLSPFAIEITNGQDKTFMGLVGIVEMIVGIGIIFKPRVFAYLLSIWFLLIILNLLLAENYYDVVLRDFGLMLSAFALGRLSQKYVQNK